MAVVVLAVLLAAVYFGATGFVFVGKRCRRCKGAKYVRARRPGHRHCHAPCPRCGGGGREMRAAAKAVYEAKRARRVVVQARRRRRVRVRGRTA